MVLPRMDKCSQLIIIECKNYQHSVAVNDVEEFSRKLQQITGVGTKGIFATVSPLQKSAKKLAEHDGIGHYRYFPDANFKHELARPSSSLSLASLSINEIEDALTNQAYQSSNFDYFMWSNGIHTNSIERFFRNLLFEFEARNFFLQAKQPSRSVVPSVSKQHLEDIAGDALTLANYTGGKVDFEILRQKNPILSKVSLYENCDRPDDAIHDHVLATANFLYPSIHIYKNNPINVGRRRFTIVHEFVHFLLEHDKRRV
nr:restriction endonuclease [Deinococcus betulae]